MESGREADNSSSRPVEGRDHLNLAEHRISVLPRQQPVDEQGRKLDEVTYRSSRYDPVLKRRVPRSVTLTTNSRLGLPTPADENVLLALLEVTRRANRFTDPKVHFTPHELMRLMGWSANSRGYERFRTVLERLSALRLIYRNAWWDNRKRAFESEFSTGLIASYELTRQVSGRRREGELPPSWILWNPHFFESFQAGAIKRLNLREVFRLRSPVSQQMYRFLDKHFFYTSRLEIDLREFACGHIGLSENYDNGKLKSRLRPAIEELESIEFIESDESSHRYRKIRPGVWRIQFQKRSDDKGDDQPSNETFRRGSGNRLLDDLTSRGVTAKVARQLVEEHSAERVRRKISVFDWLRSTRDRSVSTNPAGFLVQSIRQAYSDPPGYRSRERSASVRRPTKGTGERRVSEKSAEDDRRRELEQRIDKHLKGLSNKERTALEEEAIDSADGSLLRLYRQGSSAESKASIRRIIVRRHMARRLGKQEKVSKGGGELPANDTGRERREEQPK